MNLSFHISAPPESGPSKFALRLCQAVLADKHSIYRLFFSGPGAKHFSLQHDHPWQQLIAENHLDAVCCSAACEHFEIDVSKNSGSFDVAGLSALVEAELKSDRLLSFGERHRAD